MGRISAGFDLQIVKIACLVCFSFIVDDVRVDFILGPVEGNCHPERSEGSQGLYF